MNQVKCFPAHLSRGRAVTFVGDQLFHPFSLRASFRDAEDHEIWMLERPSRVVLIDFLRHVSFQK